MTDHQEPTLQRVPISTLVHDSQNTRKHSKRNLKAIADSLSRFGQLKPIVVDAKSTVIAGNGTLAAAAMLGWETILVHRIDLPEREARAYAIADNRTAELASWDEDLLAQQLAALQIDPTLPSEATGFSEKEIEKIIDQATGLASAETSEHQPVVFQIVATCDDEADQKHLYELLASEGYACRVLTL